MQKLLLTGLITTLLGAYFVGMQNQEQQFRGPSTPEYERFLNWTKKHNKEYNSHQERMHRFTVFKKNLLHIHTHNQQKEHHEPFYGENKFMDLEYHEFRALMMKGRVRPPKKDHYGYGENPEKIVHLNLTNLPEKVDWRGVASPKIKDQGKCGGCWAFSTVGALEGAWGVKHGLVEMSEQQLVDCCRLNLYGCNGGDPIVALDECISLDGIMRAADYPYTGVTSRDCHWEAEKVVYKPKDYAIVPHNDTMQLKMALSMHPVAVCVADSPVFHFYERGVILDNKNCGEDIDHCVVLVGYGTENGKDYWLLRNSWGSDWGEEGYMRLSRNDKVNGPGICGVQMEATYVIL